MPEGDFQPSSPIPFEERSQGWVWRHQRPPKAPWRWWGDLAAWISGWCPLLALQVTSPSLFGQIVPAVDLAQRPQ